MNVLVTSGTSASDNAVTTVDTTMRARVVRPPRRKITENTRPRNTHNIAVRLNVSTVAPIIRPTDARRRDSRKRLARAIGTARAIEDPSAIG